MAFLSTPSARRATFSAALWDVRKADFYPRPPRGGRPSFLVSAAVCFGISIHALREEGDMASVALMVRHRDFYPRPPRGGRLYYYNRADGKLKFLSTPSARRATCCPHPDAQVQSDFYPRPPRGGRHTLVGEWAKIWLFLSTPSARRATGAAAAGAKKDEFLSTPSARRATTLPKPCSWMTPFLSTPSARRATPAQN